METAGSGKGKGQTARREQERGQEVLLQDKVNRLFRINMIQGWVFGNKSTGPLESTRRVLDSENVAKKQSQTGALESTGVSKKGPKTEPLEALFRATFFDPNRRLRGMGSCGQLPGVRESAIPDERTEYLAEKQKVTISVRCSSHRGFSLAPDVDRCAASRLGCESQGGLTACWVCATASPPGSP